MGAKTETQVVPRTTYNYRILIDGLLAGLVSKVQIPSMEFEEFEHSSGGSNINTKHPGKMKFGDLVLEKAMPHETSDKWAWQKMTQLRNLEGGGDVTAKFKTTIQHLADSGDKVIDTWVCEGCWVKKIDNSGNDAMQGAERFVETVTISVRSYTRT